MNKYIHESVLYETNTHLDERVEPHVGTVNIKTFSFVVCCCKCCMQMQS